VRIARLLATTIALVAFALVFVTSDVRGSALDGGDASEAISVLGTADMVAAASPVPLVVPPATGASLFDDHRPPASRLTTSEVFRPPQARG
jgi:hypothetical protein